MKTITSRHNPIVKRYREIAAGKGDDLVLLDGAHLIEEATRAHVRLEAVACSSRVLDAEGTSRMIDRLEAAGAMVTRVPEEVMRALSPVHSPSGIVALARRPHSTLATVLDAPPRLVLVAVDVQDPGNLGAIVRAAEAGGASGAILAGATADAFGWKALRGSMGSALRLPIVAVDLDVALEAARAKGFRIVATVPRGGASPFDCHLTGPVAILLGGEGPGLPEHAIANADERVSIPMRPPVESLNVAVTAALLVYEAARQRGRVP